MHSSLQFVSLLRRTGIQRPGLRLVWALAFFAAAGSYGLLHAQSTAPTPDKPAPAVLPAAPSAAATDSSAASAPATRGFDSGTSGFGQNQPQIPAWSRGDGANFRPGSRAIRGPSEGPLQDPFQPAPSFGSLTGSTRSGMGFNGAAGGFGSGRQDSAALNPFGSAGMGGRQGNAAPLFPASDGPTRGIGGPFGTAPYALPSLNQLLRGSYNLPLNSSTSNFKFSYQDMFKPGASLSDLGRPSASAMFTTSDLGNGVFLSAGTGYGSHSMAGAPPASIGNGTAGAKHSGPSVALKLSF